MCQETCAQSGDNLFHFCRDVFRNASLSQHFASVLLASSGLPHKHTHGACLIVVIERRIGLRLWK